MTTPDRTTLKRLAGDAKDCVLDRGKQFIDETPEPEASDSDGSNLFEKSPLLETLSIVHKIFLILLFLICSTFSLSAQSEQEDQLQLTNAREAGVYLQGETPVVELTNEESVTWSIYNFQAKKVAGGTVTENNGSVSFSYNVPGYYEFVGATSNDTDVITFAILPPAKYATGKSFDELNDSFFGVQGHFARKGVSSGAYSLKRISNARLMGIQHIRDSHVWKKFEQEKGVYTFHEHWTAMMNEFSDNGITPLMGLWYGNGLYYDTVDDGGQSHFTPPYNETGWNAYGRYAARVVSEYPSLKYAEIYNEYNISHFSRGPAGQDPVAYATLLDYAKQYIHDVRDDIKLVGGAIAMSGVPPKEWIHKIGEEGAIQDMDILSIHPYRPRLKPERPRLDRPDMRTELEEYMEIANQYNGGESQDIWISEVGWKTQDPKVQRTAFSRGLNAGRGMFWVDETMQARYTVRAIAMAQAAGVKKFFTYQFRDTRNGLSGLTRKGNSPRGAFAPKPGYVTKSVIVRQLTEADFIKRETIHRTDDSNIHSYLFDRLGKPVRMLWVKDSAENVTLHTSSPKHITTMTGKKVTLQPHNGKVYLTATRNPVYIEGDIQKITKGAPVDMRVDVDPFQGSSPVEVLVDGDGIQAGSVLFNISGNELSIEPTAGEWTSRSSSFQLPYRPVQPLVPGIVYVNGSAVGRLVSGWDGDQATCYLSKNPVFDGLTAITGSTNNSINPENTNTFNGEECWSTDFDSDMTYIYFDVNDDFAWDLKGSVKVTVRYFDNGNGHFDLKYDARGPRENRWTSADQPVYLDGDQAWETKTFILDDPKFTNRQHYRRDFRIDPWIHGVGRSPGNLHISKVSVEIINNAPEAYFSVDPENPVVGEAIQFSDGSTDRDGSIVEYRWEFGDGSTAVSSNPIHTYDTGGSYSVNLTITDDDGVTDSYTQTIIVEDNDLPEANFSFDPQFPVAEEEIHFTDHSSDPDGSIESSRWEFGDGSTGTGPTATHRYNSGGTYTVTLTVTDNDGASDSVTRTFEVSNLIKVFSDGFERTELGSNWTVSGSGTAGIGTFTSASGSHSMYTGHEEVTVTSREIDLSSYSEGYMRAWIRRGSDNFSEFPETEEDLKVSYRSADGTWNLVKTYRGGGTAGEINKLNFSLPPDAFHSELQVRFFQTSGSGSGWDYWHIDDVVILAPESIGTVIGETGSITGIDNSGGDEWHTVHLEHSYSNPVVIAKPVSYNGGNPSHIRLRNVSKDSFELMIEEWLYLDGSHTDETVSYLVMEAGVHELPGGMKIEAGTRESGLVYTEGWETINYNSEYNTPPAVFAQSQTWNGNHPVVVRVKNDGTQQFRMVMQEEEAQGPHMKETLGYVVISRGNATIDSTTLESDTTPDEVTDDWYSLHFNHIHGNSPVFLANMQTADGGNTAGIRYQNLTGNDVELKIEEETSDDSETWHTTERVGYLVMKSGVFIKK